MPKYINENRIRDMCEHIHIGYVNLLRRMADLVTK